MYEENKEISLDEMIQKAYEDIEEMTKRDKIGLSLVDIMKPTQWLYNLLLLKKENYV